MRTLRRDAGMSILELVFASSIAAAMLTAGFALTQSMRKNGAGTSKRDALSSHSAEIVERLVRELAVAGMHGEDANRSGTLDSGEDANRNGRLDADWNLADGATASDFSFNEMKSDWTWTSAIRWYVDGSGLLWRAENGAKVEMARGVTLFTASRTSDEIDVKLTLAGKDATGDQQSETAERRVYVRN